MAEKKAEKKPAAPAAPAAPTADSAPRKKRMNELSPAEIEARLADCREKQGGLGSKYARQLLARKKTLGS